MKCGIPLEVELVRIGAARSRCLARAELIDDVEVGRDPAAGLFSLEQIEVELGFDLDAVVADRIPAEVGGRDTGKRMHRGGAERAEDHLEREPHAWNRGGHIQREHELERRLDADRLDLSINLDTALAAEILDGPRRLDLELRGA